jgi:5'-nucleotidase
LEFSAVGNHEFDKGSAELLRLQRGGCRISGGAVDPNSCRGDSAGTPQPFEGAAFQWLAANVIDATTGRTLLPPYGIKTFRGVKVAFIGMTLQATPTIVTPAGVAGLVFRDEADTVNALVPRLRGEGVGAIVVLVHQGGTQTPGRSDLNGCDGNLAGSEIEKIVNRLDDAVDLVISAHTHAAYNCSRNTVDVAGTGGQVTAVPRAAGVANRAGRRVPVTSASAFGRVVSEIDVTIDPAAQRVIDVRPTNRLVDRTTIVPLAAVTGIVAGYDRLIAPVADQVIGAITADLSQSNRFDAACNMPAGELIADAQLAATAPAALGGAQIAFTNRGGVRAPFTFAQISGHEAPGEITYREAFTVQPFGNSLVTMTLTAQDLKDVLEQQFAGCHGQGTSNTRIMIPSAGFRYTWDGSQACGRRVANATLKTDQGFEVIVDAAGALPQPLRTLRVTVNSFMASGGDGLTTFQRGTGQLGGAQDIDALVAYLKSNTRPPKPPYDPADPALGKPRISRIGAVTARPMCPTAEDVNP